MKIPTGSELPDRDGFYVVNKERIKVVKGVETIRAFVVSPDKTEGRYASGAGQAEFDTSVQRAKQTLRQLTTPRSNYETFRSR